MKMRSAVLRTMGLPAPYAQSKPVRIETVELDPPGPGEVLVKIKVAGLCHSDEHIRQGAMVPPQDAPSSANLPAMSPTIGGHEGSAVVLEVIDHGIRLPTTAPATG